MKKIMHRRMAVSLLVAVLVSACAGGSADISGSSAPPSAKTAQSEIAQIRDDLLSEGKLCEAIIGTYLDRIARFDRTMHAVVAINAAALAEARRIDRLPADQKQALSLACVPVLVKDNIDVAGLPTTAGSVALSRNVASADAAIVAALWRAGGIVVAKTNMSEFAFNYRGTSSLAGQTSSPFSRDESAGGSSSGSAAGLAAGFGVIALGTDTSGSVRVPAALTGTVGLRPTFGTLPTGGVIPLSPSQDVVGPMCRVIADCRIVWSILHRDRPGMSARHPLDGLRVGVLTAFMREGGVAEEQAIAALRKAGAIVTAMHLRDELVLTGANPPAGHTATFASRSAFDFPQVMDAYLPSRRQVPPDASRLLNRLRQLEEQGQTDARVVEDVAKFSANRAGAATDPRALVNGSLRDSYVAERLDEVFDCKGNSHCVDVLIYPSVQAVSAPVAEGPQTAGTHRFAAYSGRPAVAFPIGTTMTAAGLRPVSVELLGRHGEDGYLLEIAADWQARLAAGAIVPCGNLVCLTQ